MIVDLTTIYLLFIVATAIITDVSVILHATKYPESNGRKQKTPGLLAQDTGDSRKAFKKN